MQDISIKPNTATQLPTNLATDSDVAQTVQGAQLQPKNPMHGLTLEAILTSLVNHYGWSKLSMLIPVNCFSHDPSIKSSLKFLRKTPWARDKVEQLYAFMLRDIKRNSAQ